MLDSFKELALQTISKTTIKTLKGAEEAMTSVRELETFEMVDWFATEELIRSEAKAEGKAEAGLEAKSRGTTVVKTLITSEVTAPVIANTARQLGMSDEQVQEIYKELGRKIPLFEEISEKPKQAEPSSKPFLHRRLDEGKRKVDEYKAAKAEQPGTPDKERGTGIGD
jgi:hypothetical protein